MLVQWLLRLVERPLSFPGVVRLEVLLNDGGYGVLVRDDDVRARGHPGLAELVVLLGAVVVRVVLVEREARVLLRVDPRRDLVLPFLLPVADLLVVVVLAGGSDRGGEALLPAVEKIEGVRPHGLIEDVALLFREERHIGSLCVWLSLLLGLSNRGMRYKKQEARGGKTRARLGASVVSTRCCWG